MNLMVGMESLTEYFVAAGNGFSSGVDGHGNQLIRRVRQLHQGYTLCYLEEYGTEFETMVQLTGVGYNKSLLDRRNITNKSKGAGKG